MVWEALFCLNFSSLFFCLEANCRLKFMKPWTKISLPQVVCVRYFIQVTDSTCLLPSFLAFPIQIIGEFFSFICIIYLRFKIFIVMQSDLLWFTRISCVLPLLGNNFLMVFMVLSYSILNILPKEDHCYLNLNPWTARKFITIKIKFSLSPSEFYWKDKISDREDENGCSFNENILVSSSCTHG